ncbi:glycosyltransferase family 2 protein [Caulobacter hibisci]|uniref:Glycosyltransferase family 2 protein n=1 Tax=Caulobacter hibisci TaxID=2035993 RepID=A0ABS0SW10_9CAUL|nr:glycosyltransferase family 2 protein [Caulobacter hibisci]MBI1682822.1 glycosyltransferase family 2 protein [Caulobacter hibisci]
MAIDISVVILSYDRVHLLERTLVACLRPDVAPGVAFEIIVVDNHPDRLAEGLVERLAALGVAPMTYLADPRRNVSIVRNLGIKAAKGRYVAFIDDDEAPDAAWLSELLACLERTGADAAFGPKHPEFEAGAPPSWDPHGWRYTLDYQEPSDTPIHLFGRLRKKGKGLGSGNAAFRVATCFDMAEPFSVAFGDGNGEDTHLLFRLALSGKRFVWCPTAMVREFIETDRTKPSYMITRMKRGSQHYAASRIATNDRPLLTRVKVTLVGMAQLCIHAGLYVVSFEWVGGERFDHRIGMAKGLGKLTYRAPIGFIDEKAA